MSKKKLEKEFTPNEAAFIFHYFRTKGDLAEAAKCAGYQVKDFKAKGKRLLKDKRIKKRIDELMAEVNDKLNEEMDNTVATEKEAMQFLTRIMRGYEKCRMEHMLVATDKILKVHGSYKENKNVNATVKYEDRLRDFIEDGEGEEAEE